jgi:molecular chaperone GrpE|tara:strand:+ start:45 stop:464 length:420 start_codon:yes stop_codon:yes gene_type:complete
MEDKVEIDYKDKYIRLVAEFDNYKKRTTRENNSMIKNANEKLVVGLLPIVDDIERSLDYINDESTKSGIEMVLNKFKTLLKEYNVNKIPTIGNEFNSDLHESISVVESDKDTGEIIDEVSSGYTMNDKVIRYSKVVISK